MTQKPTIFKRVAKRLRTWVDERTKEHVVQLESLIPVRIHVDSGAYQFSLFVDEHGRVWAYHDKRWGGHGPAQLLRIWKPGHSPNFMADAIRAGTVRYVAPGLGKSFKNSLKPEETVQKFFK